MYCGFENYVLSSQLTKQIVFTTRRIIYIMFDIITDSACDIVREYAETHNLKLVPLYTTFDGVNYLKEQYDITHDEFYRRMTDEGAFPKSSLPSVQDFVDAIMPSVEAGRPAIVCTITSYSLYTRLVGSVASLTFSAASSKLFNVNSSITLNLPS